VHSGEIVRQSASLVLRPLVPLSLICGVFQGKFEAFESVHRVLLVTLMRRDEKQDNDLNLKITYNRITWSTKRRKFWMLEYCGADFRGC